MFRLVKGLVPMVDLFGIIKRKPWSDKEKQAWQDGFMAGLHYGRVQAGMYDEFTQERVERAECVEPL